MTRRHLIAICLVGIMGASSPAWAIEPTRPVDWLRFATQRLCGLATLDGLAAQELLPGSWLIADDTRQTSTQRARVSQRFALADGNELRIDRFQPGGRLRRFTLGYYERVADAIRPSIWATADQTCQIRAGRRIVNRSDGPWRGLEQLESDLATVRWIETLQAPWPAGDNPTGPRVALIDSGLAYDLAIFRDRLARGPDLVPLGYDFWDMDPWPYDADVSRGDFLPIRHGTTVASVLIREAPAVALIPYRYPRPDMARMSEVVRRAANAKARIIAMPLGSNVQNAWAAFFSAVRSHPEILVVVSAGNNGRDIDTEPVWPASLSLDNMIVVTSSDAFGRLARGSNWGRQAVDIMLPAENVPIVDFRGAKGSASGSSYAVPRLAAMAARMLQTKPSLTVAQLKARIFERATVSPYERNAVAIGWIPDPDRD
ncbi:MAG: S8 family peptidase [Hyphomicrobiaceae bacterium]